MASTYSYQALDPNAEFLQTYKKQLGAVPTKHYSKEKFYRKARNWQRWWQTLGQQSLGYGKYAGQATDPLARLQQQLQSQFDEKAVTGAYQGYNFGQTLGARNQALGALLQQRAAGMGVQNAYGGAMDYANRARNTLAEQSLAAYRPQAWAAQQQANAQMNQLLSALVQSQYGTEKTLAEIDTI